MSVTFLIPLAILLVLMLGNELRKARRLREKDRERNMMVALLSHRLRTPLTSIKWHTELLLNQEFGKLRIAQLELLDKVNSGISDAIQVLNTFLEVSRIERGDIAVKAVSIDVWDNIESVLASLERPIKEKNYIVKYKKSVDHVVVSMNPLAFHTVLEVILENAISYTPSGGTITIEVEESRDQVIIRVIDTGIGMSPMEQKRLFSKFFRTDKAKVMLTTGNGLGLYFAKQVLDDIHGTIACISQQGVGSTFFVNLPKEKKSELAS